MTIDRPPFTNLSTAAAEGARLEPLANALDRMRGRLRANNVEIDREKALTLGQWLAADAFVDAPSEIDLQKQTSRRSYTVPDVERLLAGSRLSPV